MAVGVQLAPLFKGGCVLGVEPFETEIDVGYSGRQTDPESFVYSSVCHCFGLMVSTMKFAKRGQGGSKDVKIVVAADHVPGTFEDERFGGG